MKKAPKVRVLYMCDECDDTKDAWVPFANAAHFQHELARVTPTDWRRPSAEKLLCQRCAQGAVSLG